MPLLLDGKVLANEIKDQLAQTVRKMLDNGIDAPHLAAVLVGEDPASQTYVAGKEKACREVGFISSVYRLEADATEAEILAVVDFLNNDPEIDGFIVQLPLPKGINADKVTQRINPAKDVDGFHPVNLGRMIQGLPAFLPATPMGIMQMLERFGIETEGKHCVVAGRSNIVGTPVSILMSRKASPGNATVTLAHSKTQNFAEVCRSADILIAAIGIPKYITADMVKEGAVVIDVGIHRVEDPDRQSGFRLVGDVDFDAVAPKTSAISPVPGGVGLLTITSLLQNTLKAARKELVF